MAVGMDTKSVSVERQSDDHSGSATHTDKAELEELIRNVVHRVISSHLPGASGISASSGELKGVYVVSQFSPASLPLGIGLSRPLHGPAPSSRGQPAPVKGR